MPRASGSGIKVENWSKDCGKIYVFFKRRMTDNMARITYCKKIMVLNDTHRILFGYAQFINRFTG